MDIIDSFLHEPNFNCFLVGFILVLQINLINLFVFV